MPTATLAPEFIDFNTAIARSSLTSGVPLACVKNPTNDLFSLRYIVEMGTNHDRALQVATEYLQYLGCRHARSERPEEGTLQARTLPQRHHHR
jgi:hypothetical protein